MARRKRPQDAAARDRPFNNPFAEQRRRLQRAVAAARDARLEALASRKASSTHKRSEHGAADLCVDDERSDGEIFAQAVSGAIPIGDDGGYVAQPPPARHAVVGNAHDEDTTIDPTDAAWFDVRFSDRFIRGRAVGVSKETIERLERGEFAVRSHVDLHGMLLEDAKRVVDEFLTTSHRKGEHCVLVITGKGRNSPRQVGVLRENIPEWLARGPSSRRILAFVTARPCDGGEGAMVVLLRKQVSRKGRIEVESGGGI